MLRGKTETMKLAETPAAYGVKQEGTFPGVEQPFTTDEHPPGVLFYRGRESFFLPYHLVQTIRFREDKLILVFATADVVITGRGLHHLYTQLAAQHVVQIVEQGERYAGASNALVHIGKIEEIPHEE